MPALSSPSFTRIRLDSFYGEVATKKVGDEIQVATAVFQAEVCLIAFCSAYNFNFNGFYFEGITTIQLLSKILLKS